MMNTIVIFGMVIGLGVAAVWALGKTFQILLLYSSYIITS